MSSPDASAPTGRVVPYGEWPSPLDPERAATSGARFGSLVVEPDAAGVPQVWWSEVVDGAGVVRRATPDTSPALPHVVSARSRVNEYGGGEVWAHGDRVSGDRLFWVEDADQRIRMSHDGGPPRAITPEPPEPRAWRHAAGVVHPGGEWTVVERELHVDTDGSVPAEAINELAAVRCAPGAGPVPGEDPVIEVVTLRRGADFVAAPALSPDGTHLAWLEWGHPDMPWDSAEVWAAELVVHDTPRLVAPRRVAAGHLAAQAHGLDRPVSACLPSWSPEGRLHFCDDRADRWALVGLEEPGLPREGAGDLAPPVWMGEGEVGEPRWVSGGSRYGFLADGTILLVETLRGLDTVRRLDPPSGTCDPIPALSTTWVESLAVSGTRAAIVAGFAQDPTTVVQLDLQPDGSLTATRVRQGVAFLDPGSVSVPEPVSFPTADGEIAHGLFHPPRLAGCSAPPGDLPPLVVRIHGGPTAHARAELSASVQFWTSRGVAVVEVNYRGSTGFGRRYRDLLRGRWGDADVQDCRAAARYLADTGRVDALRCVIRGGSAGGFTALEALCGPAGEAEVAFAAATSLYGVTDLGAMATDTHKFESRYLDSLVGPLPAAAEVYRQRSPLHHAERIAAPVLLLQGADDTIVPPSQAEVLVAALAANGIDHEYHVYEGEGHGFRRPGTVVDALRREVSFYGRILGFTPVPA